MSPTEPNFTDFPSFEELFERPSLDSWRELAQASLKGRPLEKLTVSSHERLDIPPLFTDADEAPDPGYPGQPPFTRGGTALGAGPEGWQLCPLVNHPDPTVAATLAAEDVNRGADALWLVIDSSLRTSGDILENLRGDGVAVLDSTGFEALFECVDPTTVALDVDAGGNAGAAAAALLAAARRRDLNPHDLTGSLGCDPIGALARDGALSAGLDGSYDQMTELATWTALHAPGLRPVTVSALRYHTAGASAVEELAYALATAIAYLRALTERGLEVGAAFSSIGFRFGVGRDLFIETAKLRACRRLWSRAAGACNVTEPGRAAPIHAVACPRGLAARDPWVNILRTTVGSFAAAVGGADTITVLPFDLAVGPPDELARRTATNSQTILREESHLGHVVDPGGGSWFLEALTDRLAHAAWERFQAIEHDGGMESALVSGVIADELDRLQVRRDRAVSTRRDPVTGVSSFPNLAEPMVERPATPLPHVALPALGTATRELARLHTASSEPSFDGSMLDTAIEAAAAGAGLVQLAAALRGNRNPAALTPLAGHREAEAYESLRDASDAWLADHGIRPRIFLANMGSIPEHKPRAGFATHFFEAGGIEAVTNDGFNTVDEAVAAFCDTDTSMAVICSSDRRYPDVVPELASALGSAGARTVLVAGRPGDHEDAWRKAGVDGFIHLGCDQIRTLTDLLREEGVLHV